MQQGTTKQRAAQRAQAAPQVEIELFTPQLYTAITNGNVSVNLGPVFAQPAKMRRLIASVMDDATRAKVLALCDELEAAQAKTAKRAKAA